MTRRLPLAPEFGVSDAAVGGSAVGRQPKMAELIARTVRRMIVDGRLKEGDSLPNEADLMTEFSVSRSTLREAVRVLECDRLVEVRRGSRSGARIRVPGTEIVARPAGLLLEVSGATIGDLLEARRQIEPGAARLLAQSAGPSACYELETIVAETFPAARKAGRLIEACSRFDRRMAELSGNAALSMVVGMLHEITDQHAAASLGRRRNVTETQYKRIEWAYRHLMALARVRDGDAAEAHWRNHIDSFHSLLLRASEKVKVRHLSA